MAEQNTIDWAEISAKLPYEKTAEAKALRDQLWRGIDANGNGYLSLAEVDRGVRDVLGLGGEGSLFDAKPAIMRAFQAAKNAVKTGTARSDDYVERPEFRLLLLYLRRYFELYQAFARVEAGGDNRIDRDEFTRARPLVERWVGPLDDYDAEFDKIDANGGGQILFDEFAEWAIAKSLALEEDED